MRKIQKLKVDLSEIPCPFKMYEHAERVETGPVQFNDDWPGVFIRGDNACWLALCLEQYMSAIEKDEKPGAFDKLALNELLHLLRGSHISNIVDDNDTDVGC